MGKRTSKSGISVEDCARKWAHQWYVSTDRQGNFLGYEAMFAGPGLAEGARDFFLEHQMTNDAKTYHPEETYWIVKIRGDQHIENFRQWDGFPPELKRAIHEEASQAVQSGKRWQQAYTASKTQNSGQRGLLN